MFLIIKPSLYEGMQIVYYSSIDDAVSVYVIFQKRVDIPGRQKMFIVLLYCDRGRITFIFKKKTQSD